MLSDRHRHRLKGIERADSVTADLHKLWWMPFGASALLVPDVGALRAVHHASVYLNRPEDEAEGQLNLVGRSLDTSRRFDALKVLIALRATGRKRLGEMVDAVLDLTQYAADADHAAARARAGRARRHDHGRVPPRRRRRGQHPHPPGPVRVRRGRDRAHPRQRRRRAQADADEPRHDAQRTSTPCSTSWSAPERHRQLDGALQAGRVRDGAGDPDRLQSGARLGRKPQAQRHDPPGHDLAPDDGAAQRALGPQARRSVAAPPCSPGRT